MGSNGGSVSDGDDGSDSGVGDRDGRGDGGRCSNSSGGKAVAAAWIEQVLGRVITQPSCPGHMYLSPPPKQTHVPASAPSQPSLAVPCLPTCTRHTAQHVGHTYPLACNAPHP